MLITGPNGAGKEKHRRDRACEFVRSPSWPVRRPELRRAAGGSDRSRTVRRRSRAPTPARTARAKANSKPPTAALCSSMKSARCRWPGRSNCCVCSKPGNSSGSAAIANATVKVRVLSATNADLPALIAVGQFREDLFYRLNAIEVRLPALTRAPRRYSAVGATFPARRKNRSTLHRPNSALLAHRWPGNVRELRNTAAARRVARTRGTHRRQAISACQQPAIVAARHRRQISDVA